MTRAEYEALALRVEREEPSRDLAIDVLLAFGAVDVHGDRRTFEWRGTTYQVEVDYYDLAGTAAELPDPLHSLDAAASLCPPAWWAEVKDLDEADGAWSCVLTHSLLPKKAWGNAPTEPRARTAAAIRALAQEATDE